MELTMDNNSIELAFTEWNAWLNGKDSSIRGKDRVKPNFELIFQKWKDLGAKFDDLYEIWLPKAIKAHQPKPSLARAQYKRFKSQFAMDKTEKEFIDEWNERIENTGTETFFEFFPATQLDKDDEPKVYGNMSATEYKAQRRYADQFPTLDTRELVKQWRAQQEYNLNVDDVLENVLGKEESDETNS